MRSTFWVYIFVCLLLPVSVNAEACRAPDAGPVGEDDALACVANMARVSTEHFIIASEDANTTYAIQVAELLESAYKQFDPAFGHLDLDIHLPKAKLVWICFRRPCSFRQYSLSSDRMDLSYMSGYYSSRTNRVAILQDRPCLLSTAGLTEKIDDEPVLQNHPLATNALDAEEYTDVTRIAHELAHQMAFNCGLQKRRVMYPIWLSEGLAATFEEILYPLQYLGGRNSVRLATLARMHRHHRLIGLEAFLPMTRVLGCWQTEQEVYAQSWGLFYFLSENRKSELKDYLQRLGSCEPGKRSRKRLTEEFTASFGPVSAVEEPWKAFLKNVIDRPEAKTAAITADALTMTTE